MIQTILVIIIVAAAISYLAYKVYQQFYSKNKCEGCSISKAAKH